MHYSVTLLQRGEIHRYAMFFTPKQIELFGAERCVKRLLNPGEYLISVKVAGAL